MLAFSISMWFCSIIVIIIAISLLKGNTSSAHGKVFDETVDKVGYVKALGKPMLLLGIGIFASGFIALFIKSDRAIVYALIEILVAVVANVGWTVKIQKKFGRG